MRPSKLIAGVTKRGRRGGSSGGGGGGGSDWILATTDWRDEGIWIDGETWND